MAASSSVGVAPAIWAAAVEPADVPIVRSAVVTSSPASNRPAITPISQALPVDPPPPRTRARSPAARTAGLPRRPGGPLDPRPVRIPVDAVVHRARVVPDRAVQLLAQDVGVADVAVGLGEDVDHHVEQLHVRPRPPGHEAGSVDRQRVDRGVGVPAGALVAVDDVGARLAAP